MKRIIVYAITEQKGGIENFLINYNRELQRIHLDFIKLTAKELSYQAELCTDENKFFYVPFGKQYQKSRNKRLKEIFLKGNYDALWFNSNDLASIDVIKLAKKCGIKYIICHAHNSHASRIDRTLRHIINRRTVSRFFDAEFACSKIAAEWFYGKINKAFVVDNAINVLKFRYDEEVRNKIREKYDVPKNAIIIGNVGRLVQQKNQIYLIEVFSEYQKRNRNSYLMIVGDGELKKQLRNKTNELKVSEHVIFTGEVANVNEMMSAFDVFLMPSLYEGLPVTLVEAQASGLHCLVSSKITKEVDVTGNIEYLDIGQKNIPKWVNAIKMSQDREKYGNIVLKSKYDIHTSTRRLENELLKVIK